MRTKAIVLVAAIAIAAAGCSGTPASAPPATAAPSPSPAPLAFGTFTSHGVAAELDARGSGSSVTGTLTVSDEGGRATVTLECSRSTDNGLLIIAGLVMETTYTDYFPDRHRVAVIFKRGTPVQAVWWVSHPTDPPIATCQALVDDVDPIEAARGVEPIGGSVQLAP